MVMGMIIMTMQTCVAPAKFMFKPHALGNSVYKKRKTNNFLNIKKKKKKKRKKERRRI